MDSLLVRSESGCRTLFSVGYPATEPIRRANRALPEHIWHSALEQGGDLRAGAPVAEPTGVIDLTN
ncbi:hypothetical protein SSPO_005300 [Streptomyces antimycoticus]|uniref:Uncharacterized protein n=1 Tax=Streptomyces antimycoticus TaxID=68175 RepID=A0A499UCJ1_9ACTN|nr:hypothetical protein SSPO_005300 [Streptomyces antimycoticus]